jgi:hypothetical protein
MDGSICTICLEVACRGHFAGEDEEALSVPGYSMGHFAGEMRKHSVYFSLTMNHLQGSAH